MSNEITLRGLAAAEPPRTPVRGPARDADIAPAAAAQAAALPNPNMRLDSSLGMVVIEFRSASGEVESSIPTPREIAAYRVAALTPKEGEPVKAPAPTPAPSSSPDAGGNAPNPLPGPTAAPVAAPAPAADGTIIVSKSHSL